MNAVINRKQADKLTALDYCILRNLWQIPTSYKHLTPRLWMMQATAVELDAHIFNDTHEYKDFLRHGRDEYEIRWLDCGIQSLTGSMRDRIFLLSFRQNHAAKMNVVLIKPAYVNSEELTCEKYAG